MPSKISPSAIRANCSRAKGASPASRRARSRHSSGPVAAPGSRRSRRAEVAHRALVGDVELGEAVDLVAEAVDADRRSRAWTGRRRRCRRAPRPRRGARPGTRGGSRRRRGARRARRARCAVPGRTTSGAASSGGRAEPLEERLDRRDDDQRASPPSRGRRARSAKGRSGAGPSSRRSARRARRAGSPTPGSSSTRSGPDEDGEVVGEPLGLGGGGRHDEHHRRGAEDR